MEIRDIIASMTLEEKCRMLAGRTFWSTRSVKRLGIPGMLLSDGPHGLRTQGEAGDHLGLGGSIPATCFPTASAIANTWDEELQTEIGEAIGKEAAAAGVGVVLGPGLNIKRSPLCGRNFEYYSEDPYLSGKMAAALVRGIQKDGISACAKHFAVNSQELKRMSSNSVVNERVLREIYLAGFEMAVKEGHVKSIMPAYNMVNGIYCDENSHLLTDILKNEWGFDGFTVSDWGACNDHVASIAAGAALNMPTMGGDGDEHLIRAVKNGQIEEKIIDDRVAELLGVLLPATDCIENNRGRKIDIEAHDALARRAAQEAIVLLKNDHDLLPLSKDAKIAIIGDFAENCRMQGAGSSLVNAFKKVTPLEAWKEAGITPVGYARGFQRNGTEDEGLLKEAVELAKKADVAVLYLGMNELHDAEGFDRPGMRMDAVQTKLIRAVHAVNPNTVVVLNSGGAMEMEWLDDCAAIVHEYLGGQAGSRAMVDVLLGKVNPSGKITETYPMSYQDSNMYGRYPDEEKNILYSEGLFVGYRYYDREKKEVRFPFGYGLSYTSFACSELNVNEQGASFVIENTGERTGTEIAQLYIGKKDSVIERAVQELKGFVRVTLAPHEKRRVSIPFDEYSFRYFNPITDHFETEGGIYQIRIGASSRDIRLNAEICIQGTDAPLNFTMELPAFEEERMTHTLHENSTFADLKHCHSLLGRGIYALLDHLNRKSIAEGKPSVEISYVLNMPFRALARVAGGYLSDFMVQGLIREFNGYWIIGIVQVLIGTPVQLIRKFRYDRII